MTRRHTRFDCDWSSDVCSSDVTIPSGDASGLKVYIDPPLEIRTGAVSELMLDFDVSKSFVVQGNPETPAGIKGFHFKPVVRVGNSSVHGTISGEVYSDNCTPADVTDDMPLDGATVSADRKSTRLNSSH